MSPADRTELDTGHPGPLEVDHVARAVAAHPYRVAAEVARRDLAERLHVGVLARHVSRFAVEQDLDISGEVDRADLAHDLLGILIREEADVDIVGAAVWYPIEYVAPDDARQVHARIREELTPLFCEGQV